MTDGLTSGFTGTEVYMLHEIVGHFDRRARADTFRAHDVTYAEFLVMMSVREQPDASQSGVGAFFDFSPSAVSQKVASLTRKGLVTQQRDEANRRIVRLALTERGGRLLDEMYGDLSSRASAVFETLGDRRDDFRAALADLLDVLRAG